MAKTYSEKLRDPKWQKKRLGILNRDNWTCRVCGDKENTLHIHHLYYKKGAEPWDYPDDALRTLCGDCHECETDFLRDYEDDLIRSLKLCGCMSDQICKLVAVFMNFKHNQKQCGEFIDILGEITGDPLWIEQLIDEVRWIRQGRSKKVG